MVVVFHIWVLVIILIQSQILVTSQNQKCNSDDLRGLTEFMNGLESPIHGWLPETSSAYCCNWTGISCDFSSGRIISLELPKNKLSGHLFDSISLLDQLITLNLSHNFFKGPLPNSLFHFIHLEELDLSGNEFNGALPVNMNLHALQVLDISDNFFSGFLPSGLCVNSTHIRLLSFAVNHFTGTIPPQFGNCNFLEHLSVASNFISGVIPGVLFSLPSLRELAAEDNMLTAIKGIGDSFSQLVRLDVSFNRLSGNIPDIFHSFSNLSYFSANSNNLSGEIPPSLSNSRTISYLNLRNNSLDGSISFNCSSMLNLSSLDLGTNKFSGTIPANLASCQKLKAINLSRNKLTGPVPKSFMNFRSLSYLTLSNCSFNNLSTSLKILQHCPNLTVLVLSMNFHNEEMPSDDSLQFKSLKAFALADCRLTGSIPLWLKGLTKLQVLDLSWNHLTGSVPAYLGELTALFYLDLANNSLSGEIPINLTNLQSLISRDISLEDSSLDFPLFGNRNTSSRESTLQYNQILRLPPLIDLSSNFLTGPIWPEFGNLKRLQVFNLKHNNLSGRIPSSLSGMVSIETLDLSYNMLTGTIPPSLEGLNFLSKFSVAYNDLTGIIPSRGQLLTFSSSSYEGNPGLCGNFFLKCRSKHDSLPSEDGDEDEDFPVMYFLVITGFGTGFLVTVISLLVIPRIKERISFSNIRSCYHRLVKMNTVTQNVIV